MGLFDLFNNKSDELCKAARNGAPLLVKKLLEDGVDANKTGDDGRSGSAKKRPPIHYAVENGNIDVVKLLLDFGADLENGSPLYMSAASGKIEIVKLLLERGAFVDGVYDTYDGSGKNAAKFMKTPLSVATFEGHTSIVQLLLENGANVEGLKQAALDMPLSVALLYSDSSDAIGELLIEHGASINLHMAAGLGDLSKMRELINSGVSPNKVEYTSFGHGYTPLYFAVNCNKIDAVHLLLNSGVNAKEQIEFNKNVKSYEDNGAAALLISKNGNIEMLKMLIEKGVDIQKKVHYGKSLMEFAAIHERNDIVNLLKKYM